FVIWDSKGVRPVNEEAAKNPFGRACEKLGLAKPWPRFQDLRATWKTNARRSRMHPEIEKAIMGHGERGLSVHERYGFISDEELVQAIDKMTFDNVQETRVLTADGLGLALSEKPEQNLNKSQPAKRKARVNLA
ncbi:MAG: site-specific integrase, partial [Thermodesulfobacteriota bacterium]